jgi:hypothetical protein
MGVSIAFFGVGYCLFDNHGICWDKRVGIIKKLFLVKTMGFALNQMKIPSHIKYRSCIDIEFHF